MLDMNIVKAMGVLVGIVAFIRLVLPVLKKNNIDIYDEVKLGLLLAGYTFREDKLKEIFDFILLLVNQVERLDFSPQEKHDIVLRDTYETIAEEMNLELEEEVIDLLIRIAVSTLPPTNK